jgi:hypothetical protein
MTDVSSSGKTEGFDSDTSVSKPQVADGVSKPDLNSKKHKDLSNTSFDFFYSDSKKTTARRVFFEPDRHAEDKEKLNDLELVEFESKNLLSLPSNLTPTSINSDERDEQKKSDEHLEDLKISHQSGIRDIATGMSSGE